MRLLRPSLRPFITALILLGGILAWLPKQLSFASAIVDAQQTVTSNIRQFTLPTKDIIYNPATGMIYASVPSSAGSRGNSIVPINPATSSISPGVFVGSEPNKLAISSDNQYLYVGLDESATIRRFDIKAQTAEPEFPIAQGNNGGSYLAFDLAVAPGNSSVIAVARQSANPDYYGQPLGVAIFDNGVIKAADTSNSISTLSFSATADKLYGSANYDSNLTVMSVDNTGVSIAASYPFTAGQRIQSFIVSAEYRSRFGQP